MGFPCGSAGKESTCSAGDEVSISGLGRSPGERKGYPLQYSGLENSMDCIAHGVAKSQARLRNFHFLLHTSHFNQCRKASIHGRLNWWVFKKNSKGKRTGEFCAQLTPELDKIKTWYLTSPAHDSVGHGGSGSWWPRFLTTSAIQGEARWERDGSGAEAGLGSEFCKQRSVQLFLACSLRKSPTLLRDRGWRDASFRVLRQLF